jgi:geranylgeranyl diphosphate synthase type I
MSEAESRLVWSRSAGEDRGGYVPRTVKLAEEHSPDGLAPSSDREQIDRCLAEALADAQRVYAGNPQLGPLFDRMTAFVLEGGKRLRPRLCLASYRIVSGRFASPDLAVWRAAASLEVFHAFMLIHDDLIDASTHRRDRSTLHEAIRLGSDDPESTGSRKRSVDLGLLAGDLLCALGHRMLGRSGLDDAALGRASRLVADMLIETGLGEALDVLADDCPLASLSEGPLVEAYLRKTARYTVSGPLVLGATIAGAGAKVCQALDRFGDLLGFGYQIQNDLASLAEDPEYGDHADLDGGKRTFVLWTAYQHLNPAGRVVLSETLATPPSLERRYRLLDLIHASGAIEVCQARLGTVQREAVAVLRESRLSASLGRFFITLVVLYHKKTRPVPMAGPHARVASSMERG